jgi:hypothetical protein
MISTTNKLDILSSKEYIAEDHARIRTRTADDIVVGLFWFIDI